MPRSASQLRRDALQIWFAGLEAVRSDRLVQEILRVDGPTLEIGNDWRLSFDDIRRIVVVGAGKAGAGMADAVENALGPKRMAEKNLTGWVNVPADCVRPLQRIHLHAARPAGVNEPTPEGVAGAEQILRLVESLGPDDLCLCLISGGGSALMPAPVDGISLADKLAVTRHLAAAGANIEQLNAVRKQLSRIKGGGLLRACRAGRLASLIISDVLGDPLDVIASGPTAPDSSTPQEALDVLDRFDARAAGIAPAVFAWLEHRRVAWVSAAYPCATAGTPVSTGKLRLPMPPNPGEGAAAKPSVINLIIGNNATAVAAAANEAQRLGYAVATENATQSEGAAEEVGRRLADVALRLAAADHRCAAVPAAACALGRPTCLVSGGEPVVKLVDSARRGLGGRNQQLVLAALLRLADADALGVALLSGGTDGEDGPTDAAGALLDADILAAARNHRLDPADYLARNDAYHFFEPLDALIKTGPTHTNVCDVRVVLAETKILRRFWGQSAFSQ